MAGERFEVGLGTRRAGGDGFVAIGQYSEDLRGRWAGLRARGDLAHVDCPKRGQTSRVHCLALFAAGGVLAVVQTGYEGGARRVRRAVPVAGQELRAALAKIAE